MIGDKIELMARYEDMKQVVLDFINRYDKQLNLSSKKVDWIDYENSSYIYIDFSKNDNLNNLIWSLKDDFKVEQTILNLDDVFAVYEFSIGCDCCLGEVDDRELFNVETKVQLIDRNYKNVYHAYLQTKEWYDKRNQVLKFSDYKCNRCEETENLQVHHLNYNSIGDESMNDLEVVCKSCHKGIHKI